MGKDVELAKNFRISDYKKAEREKDRKKLSSFVRQRFSERYVEPLKAVPLKKKNGFAVMAACCLLIEALEAFRQGWEDTKNKSRQAFCFFIDANPELGALRGNAQAFYQHVRCGILHQGETTGGWLIRRKGPLFDPAKLAINATKFLLAMEKCLNRYFESLRKAGWDADVWNKFRKKMKAVVVNCDC